jgi:hypothetical protein
MRSREVLVSEDTIEMLRAKIADLERAAARNVAVGSPCKTGLKGSKKRGWAG